MRRIAWWWREPVVHFVVLGVALLALYRWVASPMPPKRIVLSEPVVNGLRQDHLRRTGALPTEDEERALIDQFVDNEVLYREALALGLDRGDIIVRRRLVQKMEFLTEAEDRIPGPSDADLLAYVAVHSERFDVPARVSLTHVFFSTERHGSEADRLAAETRGRLLAGGDPTAAGEPFLRGRAFVGRSERELADMFGDAFAAQVMSLPVGTWSNPLRSAYGVHLVRVTEHVPGRQPALEEVRAAVTHEWQAERRRHVSRAALDRLRAQYAIDIEHPAEALARR